MYTYMCTCKQIFGDIVYCVMYAQFYLLDTFIRRMLVYCDGCYVHVIIDGRLERVSDGGPFERRCCVQV